MGVSIVVFLIAGLLAAQVHKTPWVNRLVCWFLVFDGFAALMFGLVSLVGTITETMNKDTYSNDKVMKEIVIGGGAIITAYFMFQIATHLRSRLAEERRPYVAALRDAARAEAETSPAPEPGASP